MKYSVPYKEAQAAVAAVRQTDTGLRGATNERLPFQNRYISDQAVDIPDPLWASPVERT